MEPTPVSPRRRRVRRCLALVLAALAIGCWPTPGGNGMLVAVDVPGAAHSSGRWSAVGASELPGVLAVKIGSTVATGFGIRGTLGATAADAASYDDARTLAALWADTVLTGADPPHAATRVAAYGTREIVAGLRVGDVIADHDGHQVVFRDGRRIEIDLPEHAVVAGDAVADPAVHPGLGRPSTFFTYGSSGGLMMTLATIDAHSPGDLTGGRWVAGTGRIEPDGAIESVGMVTAKVRAARAAGADVFLVGAPDAQEASRAADGAIEVVPVASLNEALVWLCAHGATDAVCTP